MKHLFVPYEIALQLKEKGFREECFAYYQDNLLEFSSPTFHQKHKNSIDNIGTVHWNMEDIDDVSAPLYQQVIDWLWNNYKILIYPYLIPDKTNTVMWCSNNSGIIDFWSTKDQAIKAMLQFVLK